MSAGPAAERGGMGRARRMWGPLLHLPGIQRPLCGVDLVVGSSALVAVVDTTLRFARMAVRPPKRGMRHAAATLLPIVGFVRRPARPPT